MDKYEFGPLEFKGLPMEDMHVMDYVALLVACDEEILPAKAVNIDLCRLVSIFELVEWATDLSKKNLFSQMVLALILFTVWELLWLSRNNLICNHAVIVMADAL